MTAAGVPPLTSVDEVSLIGVLAQEWLNSLGNLSVGRLRPDSASTEHFLFAYYLPAPAYPPMEMGQPSISPASPSGVHPLDALEVALLNPGRPNPALAHIAEDLPTAAEFMGLRWMWWRSRQVDLLRKLPELARLPAIRSFRHLARGCQMLVPEADPSLPPPSQAEAAVYELPPLASPEWQPGGSFLRFQDRFRTALRYAGLDPRYSDALAGAASEMASNAVEHAAAPVPPLASFEVTQQMWSFGVTDVGRGALASLRENPAYVGLETEVEALELALQEGVSRSGNPGRGLGFSTVFKALVDRQARLRFRSGGATSRWEGASPTAQAIHFQALPLRRRGFHVRVSGPCPRRRTQAP